MNTLAIEIREARIQDVRIEPDRLVVDLEDGRSISTPLAWYPRLWYGSPAERSHFEVIGEGRYIHWPDLDEDLSVAGILAGVRSGESPESLKKWLEGRKQG